MLETEFDRDIDKIGTDGQRLVFNPDWLEERFIGSDDEPPILILHQLYHCLLLHPFINRGEDTTQWHLACDLVVWYLVDKTYPETLPPEYASLCAEACAFCDKYMDVPTSDGIYRLLQSQEVEIEASRFMQDDHSLWPTAQKKAGKLPPKKYSGPGEGGSGEERVVKQWKHISDRVASLNPHMKKPGKGTRSLRKAISLSAAKRIGYTDFLKRFSVFREVDSPNFDEFQYAYYVYGIERYGNMPIIEPLEYREEHRLNELVIVIDTSGSCSRELVRLFLEETRNIIQTEGLFFRRFNLHILQCDCKVHRDDKITGIEELGNYIGSLEIIGHGGTDYRPAFMYIDSLIHSGELTNLKGVLYFTDGYGIYPADMPTYDTAFVFIKDKYDDIDVPNWALKLVLDIDI
jgi:predicted metal-dependent peptidase